uniref:Uncharacterized protein n=1 Tax=Rhizophora mucronata TaxID=61149 RepID=A0A2P2IPH6_RHIMU
MSNLIIIFSCKAHNFRLICSFCLNTTFMQVVPYSWRHLKRKESNESLILLLEHTTRAAFLLFGFWLDKGINF